MSRFTMKKQSRVVLDPVFAVRREIFEGSDTAGNELRGSTARSAPPPGATIKRRVMIAFEVKLNGKRVCVAGAEDLGVLTTSVSASGILGKKTVPYRPDETGGDVFYSVGGLTRRADPEKDVHVRWRSIVPLELGDTIQVTVLETTKVDRAKSRFLAKRKRR